MTERHTQGKIETGRGKGREKDRGKDRGRVFFATQTQPQLVTLTQFGPSLFLSKTLLIAPLAGGERP